MRAGSTQVAIIGAGPAGLALGLKLDQLGIENVILERRSQACVPAGIRAGILDQTSVDFLAGIQADTRLKDEGIPHHALRLAFDNRMIAIKLGKNTGGRVVTAYGQTEVTKDLRDLRATSSNPTIYEAGDVTPHYFDTEHPWVDYKIDGKSERLNCQIVVGCDGCHGVSRASVPETAITMYRESYPFGWLGLLADVPPVSDEEVYAVTPRGFGLCSMRSRTQSCYYLQCAADDKAENWSDERFWKELKSRLPDELADRIQTGTSIKKSIAPVTSLVAEPLRFGRLMLAGDAAHAVPPAGAKGLNLAFSDIHYLSEAVASFLAEHNASELDNYSRRALERVWKVQWFSRYMTNLTHRFDEDRFKRRIRKAELGYVTGSEAGCQSIAENFVGEPL